MRASDRPAAGSFDGDRDDLAGRLARLPDGHPSSPRDPAGEPGPDDVAPEDAAAEDLGPADQDAGAELDEPGPEDDEPSAGTGGDLPRPPAGGPGLRPLGGGGAGDPYRPWFADGGPGEPWFAAEPRRDD
jgi:hypothetical protein